MFNGEEVARIRSSLPREKLEAAIEDALGGLGSITFYDRGELAIRTRRFDNFATETAIDGELIKGRRDNEWTLRIDYTVKLSGAGMAILVLGILFFLIGILVLLAPMTAKNEVQRAVERAIRDVEYDLEEDAPNGGDDRRSSRRRR